MSVRKAVLPVAGLGTRFLPATKATPKEMLPVVDKPAIQYVVEEAVAAGITDLLFVTGRNKSSLENHFDRAPWLEAILQQRGMNEQAESLIKIAEMAAIHYVRQGNPNGLGHAIATARPHVGDEPFAVLLGDDLVEPVRDVLPRMEAVRLAKGGSVLCLMEVEPERSHLYGCAAVRETGETDVVQVTQLVEKPEPGKAPSNLAVIGRYLLDPAVFDEIGRTAEGRGGEVQLTDALVPLIDKPATAGGGVHAIIFRGNRYDTGDKLSYLKSVISLALKRDDLGPELRAWLGTQLGK